MLTTTQRLHSKWTVEEEYLQFELPDYNGRALDMWCHGGHQKLAEITPEGLLTIYKGFKWDGCTPKYVFTLLGKEFILGVWDGFVGDDGLQQLYYPSLVHDCLLRFYYKSHGINFYSRRDIDIIFWNEMTKAKVNFPQKSVYFCSVRGYSVVSELVKRGK